MDNERSTFHNFSQLKKECPRCGEINDKCGMFDESDFVMCRTDMGDSIEPKIDNNGWEYWPFQLGSGDQYNEIYSTLLDSISLSTEDEQALLTRGLTLKQIQENQYKTIPHRKGNDGLNSIIDMLDKKFELKEVPGFYLNEEKRNANVKYKQTIIPVRNFAGRITQLVLRNNGATGKRQSKYIMFSSDGKDEGGKVDQNIHFPLGIEKCEFEVRVTEGILKADVASFLGDVYCIGLHGLSSRGLIPAIEMLGVSKVRICLDIDWQENSNVLNGLRRLYSTVANCGFEVVVEEWNQHDGKGIDDVLATKGRIWELPKEECEYLLERPNFSRNEWIYINKTSQFAKVDLAPVKLMDEKHFNNHFIKFKDDFAKEAKMAVRQCDSLTYKPKEDLTIFEDNFFNLNLWKDTGVSPEKHENGDLTVFFEHLEYLFPGDDTQQAMFIDWMANVVQHRGKKFSYAMLLHGEEGTGKTWMVHCLSLILGKSNVGSVSNKYVHGNFNSMFEGKELLIINEVMANGRRDFMNMMKDYIDEKEILINKKGIGEYTMPFFTNWFMTTNYDDALLLDDKDRRYLILSSPAVCGDEKEADERGARLFAWSGGGKENFDIQEGNLAALHKFLLERKVKYNPFAKAPVTGAKVHMQEESLGAFEKFVKERIEEEMWPFNADLVCIEHIKLFPAIEKRFEKVSPHRWGKTLRRFGAVPYGTVIGENGEVIKEGRVKLRMKVEKKQRVVWILRRHQTYSNLSSGEVEELYMKRKPVEIEPEYSPPNGHDEPM